MASPTIVSPSHPMVAVLRFIHAFTHGWWAFIASAIELLAIDSSFLESSGKYRLIFLHGWFNTSIGKCSTAILKTRAA